MTSAAGSSAPKAEGPKLKLAETPVSSLTPAQALDRVAREWDKAEELMKLAERLRAEVVQPSVNELRYAGRRLVDAWKIADVAAQDPDKREAFDAYISDALFRCHCAQHDAVDASVLFVQRAIGEYEKEFGHVLLLQHFPTVADLRAALADADALIVVSRADRGRRAAEYDRLAVEKLPTIVEVYRTIASNRPALEAIVMEKTRGAGTESSRFRVSIWAVFISAIAAALMGAAATVALEHSTEKPAPPPPSAAGSPATAAPLKNGEKPPEDHKATAG